MRFKKKDERNKKDINRMKNTYEKKSKSHKPKLKILNKSTSKV